MDMRFCKGTRRNYRRHLSHKKGETLVLEDGVYCVDLVKSFQTFQRVFSCNDGFDTTEDEPCEACRLSALLLLQFSQVSVYSGSTETGRSGSPPS